jgi:dehydrogenase/reductase SDR family protein 7B
MTRLAGKTVWITGASGGIGEAMALAAAQRGARLILTARRAGELERVRQRCADPAQVAILSLDLTAFDADAATREAQSHFGPIDILVNNAGMSQRSLMLDTSMDVYRTIFELDFFAPVALTKAVAREMVARRSGHVVVVSSVVGYIGTPLRTGYAAAKHALHGFYDAASAELWRENIRFTLACPGFIKTDVSRNAITGTGGTHGKMDSGQAQGMDPSACADKIWRAVERDAEEVYIGKEAAVIWLKRFFPRLVAFAMKRAKVS